MTNNINPNIKVLTFLEDQKIKATKLIAETSIQDYLELTKLILKNNEYQRARVKSSKTVYSLLRDDLKSGCTIPPIVLAFRKKILFTSTVEQVDVEGDNLIILDGLQRTYSLIDVQEELSNCGNEDLLKQFYKRKIIIEIYNGIDKIGILYRMLTLNTGQTKMSLRHQIEILYSDLKDSNDDSLHYYTESSTQKRKIVSATDFRFNEAIECFYAFIERDPNGIERADILDEINNLKNVSEDNQRKDIFKGLMEGYSAFLKKLESYRITDIDGETFDAINFFNRSTFLSAYGAAIGDMLDTGIINDLSEVKMLYDSFPQEGESVQSLLSDLIKYSSQIKVTAGKIGIEQRLFYSCFFKRLFLSLSEGPSTWSTIVTKAYQRYSVI